MSDHEMIEETDGEQIRISFILAKGQDSSLEVPSDPIAVPSTTRKKGLSAIINHLLDRKVVSDDGSDSDSDSDEDAAKDPAIPFDFLLNNKLLRMSVEAAARREGLSLEQAVEIQYFPAREAPEGEGESESLPDWISAMSSTSDILCTGNCDGSIRLFRNSDGFNQIDVSKSHSGPIKCISSCALPDGDDSTMIASGSMDQTLLTNVYGKGGSLSLHAVYSGGHTSSINCARLLNDSGNITMASGDFEGGICVWNVPSLDGEGEQVEPSGKRRKGAAAKVKVDVKEVSPSYHFKAHSGNISGIAWGFGSSKTLLTSSWDHSIKSWDVETQNNILTLNGAKVSTCLGRCHNSDVVATGHPDCTVRLWDLRSNSKNEGNVFDGTLRPRYVNTFQ